MRVFQFYDEEAHKLKNVTHKHPMNLAVAILCGNLEVTSANLAKPPVFNADNSLIPWAIRDYLETIRDNGATGRLELVFTNFENGLVLQEEIRKVIRLLETYRVLVMTRCDCTN